MLKLDIPVSSREFCIDLVQKTGVMLTPGDAFDMEGYARIGFANELETIKVGLQALSAYLQKTFSGVDGSTTEARPVGLPLTVLTGRV